LSRRASSFEDGEFRAPAAPGSASEIVIVLGEWAIGDLDGDEPDDAAAVTIEQTWGSRDVLHPPRTAQ